MISYFSEKQTCYSILIIFYLYNFDEKTEDQILMIITREMSSEFGNISRSSGEEKKWLAVRAIASSEMALP